MTAPGGEVGRLYVSLHARTSDVEPEIRDALNKAGNDVGPDLDRIGNEWGERVSQSTAKEIGTHGDDFAHSIEQSVAGRIITLRGVRYKVDRNNALHDIDTGQFAGRLVENIVESLDNASRTGGPFSKVGEGIADAIGAGFNVSGKSPLIALLIPTFGAIAAAIAAVVQMVNALAAILTTIPALITAIGLQVGVLMIAFDGVGAAIHGAFAAKNWNEFYAAIQGLTPAAQNFIVTLLPLRDLFRELKTSVQESFFAGFGNTMVNIVQQLGPILRTGLPQLATALGGLFKNIGLFFASPTFVQFVSDVIPATLRWLGQFGPGFVSFMTAIVRMADASLPFLEQIGTILTESFAFFTSWLNKQIQSGDFTQWLTNMADTLVSIRALFFAISDFLVSFLGALDKAGGSDVIDEFTYLFTTLADFFGTEAGQAALQGFIHLVEFLTVVFAGLVIQLSLALIAFESVLQFFGFIGAAFMAFIDWLVNVAGPAIGEFFTVTIPGFFSELWTDVVELWDKITYYLQSGWDAAVQWVMDRWNGFMDWLSAKVAGVVSFFTGLPDRLADVGRQMMEGLWNGLMWGWNNIVKPVLDWITNQIPNWKGPLEKDRKLLQPTGKAVMGGFTEGLKKGAEESQSLLADFTNNLQATGMSNVFNTNLNFLGQQPTVAEARTAGAAVSEEISKRMSVLDTRLAVRMT